MSKEMREQMDKFNNFDKFLNERTIPYIRENVDINSINQYKLIDVLEKNPELINDIDVSDFEDGTISLILSKTPSLGSHFNLKKMTSPNAITALLKNQPIFVDDVDLNNLTGHFAAEIVQHQPELKDKLKHMY